MFLSCVKLLGVPTCRVLFCPKLLGDYNSQCILNTPLIWRDWFIIFLKHASAFGDPVSLYIFNTPFYVAKEQRPEGAGDPQDHGTRDQRTRGPKDQGDQRTRRPGA